MILLIYNQKMCREILLPNLRDSDYAISISGKAYGLRQDIRLLLEITQMKLISCENREYFVKMWFLKNMKSL